ncbi:MAG: hypothetical protein ABL927_13445, partial [Bdellovibrionales bacterium]
MIYTYIILTAVLATSIGIGFYLFEKIDYVERQNKLLFKDIDDLNYLGSDIRKNVIAATMTEISNLQKRLQANDNNFSEFQASIENTLLEVKNHSYNNAAHITSLRNDLDTQRSSSDDRLMNSMLDITNATAKLKEEIEWLKLKLANQPPLKLKVYFPKTKKKMTGAENSEFLRKMSNEHGAKHIDEKLVKSIK